MFFLLRLIVGAIGNGDPFVSGYRDITKAALGVPLQNALIVLVMGAAIVAASVVLSRLERIVSRSAPLVSEDDY